MPRRKKSWIKAADGSVWDSTGNPSKREFYRDTVMNHNFQEEFGERLRFIPPSLGYPKIFDAGFYCEDTYSDQYDYLACGIIEGELYYASYTNTDTAMAVPGLGALTSASLKGVRVYGDVSEGEWYAIGVRQDGTLVFSDNWGGKHTTLGIGEYSGVIDVGMHMDESDATEDVFYCLFNDGTIYAKGGSSSSYSDGLTLDHKDVVLISSLFPDPSQHDPNNKFSFIRSDGTGQICYVRGGEFSSDVYNITNTPAKELTMTSNSSDEVWLMSVSEEDECVCEYSDNTCFSKITGVIDAAGCSETGLYAYGIGTDGKLYSWNDGDDAKTEESTFNSDTLGDDKLLHLRGLKRGYYSMVLGFGESGTIYEIHSAIGSQPF